MPAIERAGAGSPHARSGGARSAVEAIGPSRGGRRAATGNHQGVSLKAQSTEGTATRRPIRDESLTAGLRRRGLPHLHSRADASSRCRPLDVCCRRRGPTRQDHRSLSSATFLRARLAATIGRTPFRGSGPATPFAGPGSQSSLLFWAWSLPWQLSSPQPRPLPAAGRVGRRPTTWRATAARSTTSVDAQPAGLRHNACHSGADAGGRVVEFPKKIGSSGWTRTSNPPVNSRMLCQLSY